MKFIESERQRLVRARDALFGDPGQGVFRSQQRDFVLSEPRLNLWAGIREDALKYFADHRISWWYGGKANDPTGHLLSSQIACVNHLYFMRQRADVATAVLRALDPEIECAAPIDGGFVTFEFIGSAPYLAERAFTRGANCTSVDAAMVGVTVSGERRLFLIEWKYVEAYPRENKYIPERAAVYDQHIRSDEGPFKPIEPHTLYYEPFYQLMRQTLLGWLLARNGDLECRSFRHVHVAPHENVDFHRGVTAPELAGESVYDAWRGVLREPELFLTRSPQELLSPAQELADTRSALNYLAERYWTAGMEGAAR